MKVIGAGFGRTGTLSLKVALETLGFGPCYHMSDVMNNPLHARFWLRAIAGKTVDWQAFFHGYQATVDWPGCTFYQELIALYPEAKVLLTIREPESWYESTDKTIYRVRQSIPPWLLRLLGPVFQSLQVPDRLIWEGTFHGRFGDRAYALAIFQRHLAEVKAVVPAERLLVYHVKEGWAPLCHFLGVPIPVDQPFPHLNDTAHFQQTLQQRVRLAQWLLGGGVAAALLGLIGVLYFFI